MLDAKAARRALERSDVSCEVTLACSSDEVRDALSRSSFDLAILDYQLGEETGLDVLDVIGNLPAIMATGSGNEDVAVQAMRNGAYDYVVKDAAGEYLTLLPQVVRNVMNRRWAELQQIELVEKLQVAVDEIKTLQGLIPICCKCRKVRNKDGYWQRIEKYIEEHTNAKITHGYCESCAREMEQAFDRVDLSDRPD